MLTFKKQCEPMPRPLRWAMSAAIFAGVAGLGGCAFGHHDYGDYEGRPARYEEHNEGWHREHDGDREHFEHRDEDRR